MKRKDTLDYNQCYPNCPMCGTTMEYGSSDSEFKCPSCGHRADIIDDDDCSGNGDMPFVCTTCGGPWPSCETSCKMFDD